MMGYHDLECHRCGADCRVPESEPLTDCFGERRVYCSSDCRWAHPGELGVHPTAGDFTNPIVCGRTNPGPSHPLPLLQDQLIYQDPRDQNPPNFMAPPQDNAPVARCRIPPTPEPVQWPPSEIPPGGNGYAYPSVSWLHNFPEERVFSYLIDSYRIRMQDIVSRPITRLDVFYPHLSREMVGFKHYLDLAEETPGILPIWWSDRRDACEAMCEVEPYYDLKALDELDKEDVIDHYGGDPRCIRNLRCLAMAIFGYSPGLCRPNEL